MSHSLDLTSFEKAHASLAAVLAVVPADETQEVLKRDATIQRFEYTYEIACRMLKRYLETASPSPATIDELGFRDLLRVGAEAGLIRDPEKWFVFREMRNITSHAYDEKKAVKICAVIPGFVEESKFLLVVLRERTA